MRHCTGLGQMGFGSLVSSIEKMNGRVGVAWGKRWRRPGIAREQTILALLPLIRVGEGEEHDGFVVFDFTGVAEAVVLIQASGAIVADHTP